MNRGPRVSRPWWNDDLFPGRRWYLDIVSANNVVLLRVACDMNICYQVSLSNGKSPTKFFKSDDQYSLIFHSKNTQFSLRWRPHPLIPSKSHGIYVCIPPSALAKFPENTTPQQHILSLKVEECIVK
jgi:hypothetical protein